MGDCFRCRGRDANTVIVVGLPPNETGLARPWTACLGAERSAVGCSLGELVKCGSISMGIISLANLRRVRVWTVLGHQVALSPLDDRLHARRCW